MQNRDVQLDTSPTEQNTNSNFGMNTAYMSVFLYLDCKTQIFLIQPVATKLSNKILHVYLESHKWYITQPAGSIHTVTCFLGITTCISIYL